MIFANGACAQSEQRMENRHALGVALHHFEHWAMAKTSRGSVTSRMIFANPERTLLCGACIVRCHRAHALRDSAPVHPYMGQPLLSAASGT